MVSVGSGGNGRHKSLDAEVNLVPFIDLLSMCICFLLMTAVWVQIGAMEIKQSKGTEAGAPGQYELNLNFTSPLALQVVLKKQGKNFQSFQVTAKQMDELLTNFEGSIQMLHQKIGMKGNESTSLITAAMITPKEGVNYGDMVRVLDVLRKNKILNLGIVPAGSAS